MLVHQFLENSAEQYSYNEALIYLDGRINYMELERAANRLANELIGMGVRKGDRVAILQQSSINYVISYFGILKAGGAVVALNTDTTSRILLSLLTDCSASAIIIDHRLAHHLNEVIDELPELKSVIIDGHSEKLEKKRTITSGKFFDIQLTGNSSRPGLEQNPGELAMLIYTSGTTGNPKGVMLSHKNLQANTDSIVEYLQLTSKDKVMDILPFYYSYGNSLLLTHIRAGGALVIDNRFAYPNVILEVMSREKVTGFSGVPSTFAILMHKSDIQKYHWEHLRYLTQAGGPMSPALTMKIMKAIPHVRIFIMYGQTEAAARLSYLEPELLLEKIGSIGKAIPGVILAVKDDKNNLCKSGEVGEIVASGDNIMMGYWNQPEETSRVLKADGLHTGDLAKSDSDGFLYIVSRKSDMIKSGAHRISPKEIEEIIAEHDAVVESAVVGVPDEILGEALKAIIVLKHNSKVNERDILKHCRANLPSFKVPRTIEFVENLPKTSSGKIKKFQLKSQSGQT